MLLVQIGHNCVVGEDNIICSQTGLAGSSILEKNVLLAGQVGISGHLTIHEGATVYAQSGIGGDVPRTAESPDRPPSTRLEWLSAITAFQKLPELLRTVRELKKFMSEINRATASPPSPAGIQKRRFSQQLPTRAPSASSRNIWSRCRTSAGSRSATRSSSSARRGFAKTGRSATTIRMPARWPSMMTEWSKTFRQRTLSVRGLLRRRAGHHGSRQSRRLATPAAKLSD